MSVKLTDQSISYMGALYAAVRYDFGLANPEDIGMDGMPIRGWRQAYAEGVKDTIEGILARLESADQHHVHEAIRQAYEEEIARLNINPPEPR